MTEYQFKKRYRLLDNTIDEILANNGVHNSDEDLQP